MHPNGLQQQLVEWCTTVENTTYMCAKPSVRNLTNAKSLLGLTKETVCVLSSFFSIVGSVETQPEHTYRGMVAYRLVLRHSGTVSSLLNQYVKTVSSRSIPLVYNLHIRSAVGEVMAVPKLPRFVFEQSKRKVHCISCKKICSICSYARLIMMSRILLCRASACSQILSLRAGLAAGITRISVISNFGNDYWSGSLLWNTTTDLKICTELVQYLGEFTTTLMLQEYQTVKIGFLGDPPYFNMKRANLKCQCSN